MTKNELITALLQTVHSGNTPVCVYQMSSRDSDGLLEHEISDIAGVDESISDRIDLNII